MKLSAQRRFHTKKILHTETLKRRRFHIQKLVIIQMPFMHKRFSTFFYTQMLLRRSLRTGHCYALTRAHFHRERSSPRRSFSRAESSQFGLGCFLRIWCGKSSSVRSSSVLPEGVRNKRIAIYFNVFVLPEQVRQGKKQITMLLGVGFTCRDASIKQCVEVWKLWVNVVSVR
jgi:hypothetical protein